MLQVKRVMTKDLISKAYSQSWFYRVSYRRRDKIVSDLKFHLVSKIFCYECEVF